MKRISSSQLLVAASAVFSFFISFFPAGVDAVEINVPKDFATIQAAILSLASSTGFNSVVVAPGTYVESIKMPINVNITIKGTETARTFLSGNGGGPVVTVDGQGALLSSTVNIQNFTFVNASSGIRVLSNSIGLSTINITNNVFQGLAGAAVTESFSPSTHVVNNTFYFNTTALACDSDIFVSNNIFSRNNTAISNTSTINNVTNNDFFNNTVTGLTGTTTPLAVDPLFVDPVNHDFHLMEGSLCINAGSDGKDIGAYGGLAADTIPFPIMSQGNIPGLTITSTTNTSIGLTWLPNKSYLVTNLTNTSLAGGYNLYVGPASGSYTGALTSSGTISSPINVGLVTSYTLTGLIPLTTPPAAPDTVLSSPRDSALLLNWTAVPGATGYEVHYGISSPNENIIDTKSAAPSWELQGLVNGQRYLIAVKAYAQQQYFFNVTAFDNQYIQGSATAPLHESVYLATNETSTQIGQKQPGVLSTVITDFPEALITYPALPNTGGRCFIATAAYGYYSAPEVQALRAFRDRYLLTTAPGRLFVEWYYRHGPAAAAFLNDHPGYKPVVRAALMPVVVAAIFMTETSPLFKSIVFLVFGAAIAFGLFRKGLSGTGGLR